MINIFLRRLIKPQPALSLIELLVALTILALLSTAGLKMFQSTQTSFVDGRTSLVKAKRNEAIAAFIYNDFVDKALPPTTAPRLYVNNQMPDDLKAAEKLNSCDYIWIRAAISIDVATHRQVCAVN
jgi:prepilin-type N-terminal cleavage/methylation domain-containing protein